ncbi:hypothetical protein GH714_012181 [Hevea brasiliensis]|uniref:Uncharacterized protein n=1 Tax=Hevea brasiliensis TaxID=3981 RepID=A0A6A6N0X0_HEVBR|nr:hypothetical protein GH714_012181 [Hevea brasiliensis]
MPLPANRISHTPSLIPRHSLGKRAQIAARGMGSPVTLKRQGEPQSAASKEDDSESKIGFGWKAVLAGYGCGLIFGIAMGYVVFKTRNPAWFVRMVEGFQKPKRVLPCSNSRKPFPLELMPLPGNRISLTPSHIPRQSLGKRAQIAAGMRSPATLKQVM